MADYGDIPSNIPMPASTSIRRNAADTAFETYTPSSGSGTVSSVGVTSSDLTVSGSPITSSGNITLNLTASGVGADTYSGVTVDTKGRVTNGTKRSFNALTSPLNTAAQISATRDVSVSYAVDIACTLTLTGGQAGTVILEYADDSAFMTNVVEVCRTSNGNTGTLTIGLSLTQTATGAVSGIIPAGKYRRLRTVNTTGTPTFTARPGQEVTL